MATSQALPMPSQVQALAHAAAERVAQALPLSWRNELHQNAERSLHVPVFYFGRPDQATVLSARELITEHNLITSAFEHMRHSVQLKPVGTFPVWHPLSPPLCSRKSVELLYDSWWRPTVGQPDWACVGTPVSPVLPLEGAERGADGTTGASW